jgi:hypothetical protein
MCSLGVSKGSQVKRWKRYSFGLGAYSLFLPSCLQDWKRLPPAEKGKSVLLLPKKDDSPQRAQRKFEVKQGNTPFSLLYSVHSLSDNNRIFWLTYLLHESTEKRLILFCILNMKLFSAFSVV